MKKIRITNWKTYSFEFLSIFIAVVSAFALNNWNENRKSHLAENKILTEIYHGLEKDLEDIKINVMGHQWGVNASGYFRKLLAGRAVDQDSIRQHYFYLTRDFVSVQNVSGYETLKSRGLELIDNDSLRSRIISLYEHDYNTLRKLEEEYFAMQFEENYFREITLSIAKNFEFDDNQQLTGIATPLEMEEDKKKMMLVYLWKMQANRDFMLKYYSEVEERIKELRVQIRVEIEEN